MNETVTERYTREIKAHAEEIAEIHARLHRNFDYARTAMKHCKNGSGRRRKFAADMTNLHFRAELTVLFSASAKATRPLWKRQFAFSS